MSDIAIRVENLGKLYRIGRAQQRHDTLRDALVAGLRAPLDRLRRDGRPADDAGEDHIWALKDVSFEVKRGEVVGIIGRNGAGKSTLLKILSRITEPTEGRAEVYGRVGSLLEVGTGFHPELTGRENIYLNGAILGMKRAEIGRKFDEMVEFSGVEKFLDTPVKRYSSGMYVRLAFAVAAHLEPEILLVDEVLAVGDAEFQKKCLGKMGDVAREGRTVLFVSHNMAAVQQLCQKGTVLADGQVAFVGEIQNALAHYVQSANVNQCPELAHRKDRRGSGWLRFTRVVLCDLEGNEIRQVLSGQDVLVRIYYASSRRVCHGTVMVSFNVKNAHDVILANLNSTDTGDDCMDIYSSGFFQCVWPRFNLRSGRYSCNLYCAVNGDIVDWLQSAFVTPVEDGDFFGTGKLIGRHQGDILISHAWSSHPC